MSRVSISPLLWYRVTRAYDSSTIETPILGKLPKGDIAKEREVARMREIALKRVGQPDEIAQCIMFLTSGRSSFVTATYLAADGGYR
jgi:NAD(P)-dependent dehydrogenase (short-subunit alcohol dehydrogenase family)